MEFTEGGEKFDDGDYFQFNKDGTVKLRGGKAKLDLSKMSKDDLRKLGIDTKYMTKEQISKKLKVRDDVMIHHKTMTSLCRVYFYVCRRSSGRTWR